ncbi:MAG: hypothetical protein EB098_12230 [Betaproteobacteria bacterium]|nr:hypothetical protein [Betaproteobacteria bacterium]
MATEGFDEYFFAHKRLQAVTGLYPGAEDGSAACAAQMKASAMVGAVRDRIIAGCLRAQFS